MTALNINLTQLATKQLEQLQTEVQQELARREITSGTSLSPLKSNTPQSRDEITLYVTGKPDYNEPESTIAFKIRSNVPLNWLTKQYLKKTRNREGSLKFTVGDTNRVIWGDMTAADAQLTDGDTIRVTMAK
uniref:Ubiquitin-like domain-containing protein n=1 Tax=Percolomonas cosmopolitus TaxID=63605 RepID=A0A7S1KTG1_9EUKA